jgi:hypothetical protein
MTAVEKVWQPIKQQDTVNLFKLAIPEKTSCQELGQFMYTYELFPGAMITELQPGRECCIMIPNDGLRHAAEEILENLPEYSYIPQCTKWKYDELYFEFYDQEDELWYKAGPEVWIPGMSQFLNWLSTRKSPKHFYVPNYMLFADAGCWDADVVDCFIQFSLFGELVYG